MNKKLGFFLIIFFSLLLYFFITIKYQFSIIQSLVAFFLSALMIALGVSLVFLSSSARERTRLTKILFVVSIFLISIGAAGRSLHLPYFVIIMGIGTLLYTFGFAPLELKSKYQKWLPYTNNKTESILLSSIDFIGYTFFVLLIFFKIQHWPGASGLLIIGVVGLGGGVFYWNSIFKKEVVNRKASEERIKEQYKEIQDSINYAKRIQTAILPPSKLFRDHLKNSFIVYKPKDIVAGDFYWLETKDDKLLFAAADCTGHGVPGALVSVICNNGLNRSVREFGLTDPGQLLDSTRDIILHEFEKSEEDVRDGMDIALCSLAGNDLQYAGANNPLWIISEGSDEIMEIKANRQPVGKFSNPSPYTTHKLKLKKGDTLYLFSDGFADQFGGPDGKKYKYKPFKDFLIRISRHSINEQQALIEKEFSEWKGDLDQVDDVLIIGVKFD